MYLFRFHVFLLQLEKRHGRLHTLLPDTPHWYTCWLCLPRLPLLLLLGVGPSSLVTFDRFLASLYLLAEQTVDGQYKIVVYRHDC